MVILDLLHQLATNLISFTDPSWQQVILVLGILMLDIIRCYFITIGKFKK